MRTVANSNESPQIQALADEDVDLDLHLRERVCGSPRGHGTAPNGD
jgi:hypothetical protein